MPAVDAFLECRWKELNLRQWIFSPLLYRLSYICLRNSSKGRKMGLEPIFLWSQHKVFPVKLLPPSPSLPDRNRTNNLLLIRQALYQLSYRQWLGKTLPVGFEPTSSQPQCEILTQLNYGRGWMLEPVGFEPTHPACKTGVLPSYHYGPKKQVQRPPHLISVLGPN